MALAKPSSKIDWTVGNPDFATVTQEPTAQKKEDGWFPDERPSRETFNWVLYNLDQWVKYLEQEADKATTISGLYDAIVAPTGTHATINAVIADMDGVTLPTQDVRIFVEEPQVPTSTQLIDKEGVEISFHPKASMAKGAALVIGLKLDAKRIKVLNGRFLNFDEGGGKAIELTANAKNCQIVGNTFNNNTNEIDDLGSNNVLANNIVEVA